MEEETKEETDITIARRTRSHVKIDDSILNDNLDLPDVDLNLYQNPVGDQVYNNFLTTLYQEEFGQETNNTDDNDTDYVYNNDIYSHGWAFDLNEVEELKTTCAPPTEEGNQLHQLSSLKFEPKIFGNPEVFANSELSEQLNNQLKQSIQLLTQTYLLTKNAANMRFAAEAVEKHLQSYVSVFKDRTKPSNLMPALELIGSYAPRELIRPSVRLTWRHLPMPDYVIKVIQDHPNIFPYPNLLPRVSYSFLGTSKTTTKDTFTPSEDQLLAYALHEFRGEPTKYQLISSLLLATKTKKQIINHVKNIKRSSADNNPIKLYFEKGQLPLINHGTEICDIKPVKKEHNSEQEPSAEQEYVAQPEYSPRPFQQPPEEEEEEQEEQEVQDEQEEEEQEVEAEQHTQQDHQQPSPNVVDNCSDIGMCDRNQECDNIMDMDLDDLVAASSTISKQTYNNNNTVNKYARNLEIRKSVLNLMSHNFVFEDKMGSLIINNFLALAREKLNERHYLHLLQLLTDLGKRRDSIESTYKQIMDFLTNTGAPQEFRERVILFLNLEQATRCGCAMSYLHWMRFFQFMQHMELYHDGSEVFEKKLIRLVDALQKDDPHKIKLAVANMVNKHPFLKREFDSLCLAEKPHQSLFMCEEDFDDITEPFCRFESGKEESRDLQYEHFMSKVSKEELSYASQHCPCKCHAEISTDGQPSQHCGRCNLKFMRGRMYLVNKIKPILAEWSYVEPSEVQWTFEEDREILEFCRCKAERSDETVSFDTQTFEELASGGTTKKTARDIAKRFNDLMDIYKDSVGNH